jgi:acetyl esterase
MALDDATTAFLAQMAAAGPPINELDPVEARVVTGRLRERFGPGPSMARVEDHQIDSTGGAFPVRVLVPGGSPRAVIVYHHGGGWVIGGIDQWEAFARTLAERSGCAVVLTGYRLAPEHRHPAAVDDAWAALRWADAHSGDIAGRRVPLIVAGDSAGANLATVTARRARDEGGPEIGLQVLAYPATDCDLDRPSYLDPANQLMVTRDGMIWFWDHYLPDHAARRHPDASPLRAPDLSGLPPAAIVGAEYDVLRDEVEEYAERLRAAGVEVTFRRFDGQMHGFLNMVNILPASADALTFVVEAIEKRLAGLTA